MGPRYDRLKVLFHSSSGPLSLDHSILLAETCMEHSDPTGAAVVAIEALEKFPENLELLLLQGEALLQLEEFKEAEAPLRKAVFLAPENAHALRYLALCLDDLSNVDKGLREEVINYYQLAIDADPRAVLCRNNLANIFMETGEYTEAADLFYKILEIDPTNVIAHSNYGAMRMKQNIYDRETEEHLKYAWMHGDELYQAGYHLVLLELANGHRDAALAYAEFVVDVSDHHKDARISNDLRRKLPELQTRLDMRNQPGPKDQPPQYLM